MIASKLYFPTGVVFQLYRGEETALVAEPNRYRLMRVYLNGEKRGNKEIGVDKLDAFVDNMQVN